MKFIAFVFVFVTFTVSVAAQATGFEGVTAQAGLVTEFDVNGLNVI
jgi:hypothetical protein